MGHICDITTADSYDEVSSPFDKVFDHVKLPHIEIIGLQGAVYDAPRPGPEPILDARQEAAIVAMVCSKAPDGVARWSISLFAKEAVRRQIVLEVSNSTIGRLLKRHELKPWREKKVVRR